MPDGAVPGLHSEEGAHMPQRDELKALHSMVIDMFEHVSPTKWREVVKDVLERGTDGIAELLAVRMEEAPGPFLEFLDEYADWKRLIGSLAIADGSAFDRHFWAGLISTAGTMPFEELQPYATECAAMLMRETAAVCSSRPLSKAEELNDEGFERHHAGAYQEAIPLHDQAIAAEPGFSLAWVNKGIALKNLGRLDEAIACYDQVIEEIDAENKKAWHNKGVALLEKGEPEAAAECFGRALEIDPEYEVARRAREACMSASTSEAMESGIHLPADEQALSLMQAGAELANRGNWAAAARLYAQVAELEPGNAWSLTLLGEALVEANETAEAAKHLQRAVEHDDECGMAWLNLMRCYLPSQEFAEALRAADRACELMPDFSMAWASRSSALLGLSRFGEAADAARKGLELDGRNHVALYNLGASLWQMGMLPQARETLGRYVEWFFDSPASESARAICDWLDRGGE